jgi:hypothetical protein
MLKSLFQGNLAPQDYNFKSAAPDEIYDIIDEYCAFGGIPLVYREKTKRLKFFALRQIIERGLIYADSETQEIFDIILTEIGRLDSREFSYQGILNKTRLRRREKINKVIQYLINQGYLFKKTLKLFHDKKTSYLFTLSLADPGIRHYLTGAPPLENQDGHVYESIIHVGLKNLQNFIETKSEIRYYKPYSLDINGNVKYENGEIDFIFCIGDNVIPIEVKAQKSMNKIDCSQVIRFINTRKSKFGIIMYRGQAYWNSAKGILFLPIWAF